MLPKNSIRIAALLLLAIAAAIPAAADTFRLLAVKGADVTAGGRPVPAGSEFTDRETVIASWHAVPAGTARYLQFINTSTGHVCVVTPPDERHTAPHTEPGFWDRLMACFSDIRRCSTRSADSPDELLGDLSDRLSRTFYLLRDTAATSRIDIATALPLDGHIRYLEATYTSPIDGSAVSLPLHSAPGRAILPASAFASLPPGAPRTVLRLSITYVDTRADARIPLCDSLNLILLEP